MDIGITTRSFSKMSNAEAAEWIASAGFRQIELCFCQADSPFWAYNSRVDLAPLTDDRARSIIDLYRSQGLTITALGVFTNLLEPDPVEREANLQYFVRLMDIAAANAIPFAATECGFLPGRRGIQAETFASAYQQLVNNMKYLADRAAERELYLALEPCILDILPSAKRTADFISDVNSDRVKVLLDPANLIANNTPEEMFAHLAEHLAYIHGKDRKINDTYGRLLGEGDIDWVEFFRLYQQQAGSTSFILEYVQQDNCIDTAKRAQAFYQSAMAD